MELALTGPRWSPKFVIINGATSFWEWILMISSSRVPLSITLIRIREGIKHQWAVLWLRWPLIEWEATATWRSHSKIDKARTLRLQAALTKFRNPKSGFLLQNLWVTKAENSNSSSNSRNKQTFTLPDLNSHPEHLPDTLTLKSKLVWMKIKPTPLTLKKWIKTMRNLRMRCW